MKQARKCGCCREIGHTKPKCPNKERVKREKAAVKAAKLALQAERKAMKAAEIESCRLRRELKRKLAPPRAGQSVKGRDGSTRHGMVISYSKCHGPAITEHDLDYRNHLLDIDSGRCFWCSVPFGKGVKKCGDHLHPCCVTARSCYAWHNALSIVPSCDACNSHKGKKLPKEWAKELPSLGWSSSKIKALLQWIDANSDKLILQKEDVEYIESQFIVINEFHKKCEDCARDKTDIAECVSIGSNRAKDTEIAKLKAELEKTREKLRILQTAHRV